MNDVEIDKILLEAKEMLKDSYAQAKPLFERIQDYREPKRKFPPQAFLRTHPN